MFEKVVEIGLLFDFYGNLLSKKQFNVIELYYIHDLSLSEIAEHLSISRQGVYDNLKRAENLLYNYEDKLGLVEKFEENQRRVKDVLNFINEILSKIDNSDFSTIKIDLEKIRTIIIDILKTNQEVK